jgi:hypothetical protein
MVDVSAAALAGLMEGIAQGVAGVILRGFKVERQTIILGVRRVWLWLKGEGS